MIRVKIRFTVRDLKIIVCFYVFYDVGIQQEVTGKLKKITFNVLPDSLPSEIQPALTAINTIMASKIKSIVVITTCGFGMAFMV
jgi:hypothetical protein